MRLIEGIVLIPTPDGSDAVATGPASRVFHGTIHNNQTADLLFRCLLQETTEEALVQALLARYDVDRDTAVRAVEELLGQLKEAGLLDGSEHD